MTAVSGRSSYDVDLTGECEYMRASASLAFSALMPPELPRIRVAPKRPRPRSLTLPVDGTQTSSGETYACGPPPSSATCSKEHDLGALGGEASLRFTRLGSARRSDADVELWIPTAVASAPLPFVAGCPPPELRSHFDAYIPASRIGRRKITVSFPLSSAGVGRTVSQMAKVKLRRVR